MEVYILHKRYRDQNGKSNIEIIGVYQDLQQLIDSLECITKPDAYSVKQGLDAIGSYFVSDNARVFYDIYQSRLI